MYIYLFTNILLLYVYVTLCMLLRLCSDNGGSDLQSALHFIEQEFLSRLPAGKSVSIQVVTARWKRDIRAAFDDVKSMLYDSNKESLLSAAAKLRAKKQQLLKQSTSSNNNKSWFVCG